MYFILILERKYEFDRLENDERLRKQNTRWLESVISVILYQAQTLSQENFRRLVISSVDEIVTDRNAEVNSRRNGRLEKPNPRWVESSGEH